MNKNIFPMNVPSLGDRPFSEWDYYVSRILESRIKQYAKTLGVEVTRVDYNPVNETIIFKTEEDLNLFKLIGEIKEGPTEIAIRPGRCIRHIKEIKFGIEYE